MLAAWRRWHSRRAWLRWPTKLALFVLGVGLVLYPRPWLLPVSFERLRDLNSTLDPQHPGLAPFEADVRERLGAASSQPAILKAVEKVVYERIPYAWDWQVWGVMEYVPTLAEVLAVGREDCDGRAVVAASLLRRMGYEAHLVSDLLHVWVETPMGDTMSPTGGQKTLSGTADGTSAVFSLGLVQNLARGLSYGVAVFPFGREIVVLLLLAALSAHPRATAWRLLSGVLLLWIALDVLRDSGQQAAMNGSAADVAWTATGAAVALAGWLVIAVKDRAGLAEHRARPAE